MTTESKAMARFSTRQWGAILIIACAQGLDVSSLAVVNASLPSIGADLEVGEATLQWAMTGYAVAFAGFLLFGGRCADILGRRFVFGLGVSLFTVASLTAAIAPNAPALIVSRAAQGAGAALSIPAALALITHIFPAGPRRARALGIYASVGAVGFGVGLVVGAVLTDIFGWRSVFVFTCVVSALVLAGVRSLLPAGGRHPSQLDTPGAASVTAGLVLAVLGVSRGSEAGWSDAGTLTALLAAVGLLVAFVVREARAADPLLPLALFRSPHVRAATLAAFLFYFVVNGLLFFAPLYMQQMLGYSVLLSGLAVLPMGIVVFIACVIAPGLMARVGQRPMLIGGLALIVVGSAMWALTPQEGGYWFDLLPGIVIMSVGQGFSFTAFTAAALDGVPQRRHGVAAALNVTAQQAGSSLGTAILVAVASAVSAGAATGPAGDADRLSGYHVAYLTGAAVALVGTLAIALLPALGRGRPAEPPADDDRPTESSASPAPRPAVAPEPAEPHV